MKTIDIHAHWYPGNGSSCSRRTARRRRVPRAHGRRVQPQAETHHQRIRRALRRPGRRVKQMDERRRRRARALAHQPMVYWAPPAFGLALSQAFNDAASAAHAKHPDRFIGFAMLPMQAPGARGEGARARGEAAGHARPVPRRRTSTARTWTKALLGRLRAVRGARLPIFLHPVDTIGQERTKQYYLINLCGNPVRHRRRRGAPHLRRRAGRFPEARGEPAARRRHVAVADRAPRPRHRGARRS